VNNGTGPSAPSYASGILYWGHGAIAQMTQGALADKITIDARMRTTGVTASGNASLSLGYTYFANGNVNTHTVQGLTQTFTYDAVNRLVKASESGGAAPEWNQSFTYDQWGNRSLLMSSSFNPYAGITPTSSNPGNGWLLGQNLTSIAFNLNNQVVGATYLGGNQTGDLATTTDSAVYDGENRLSTVTEIGTVTQYTYDGDGRRVLKALCTSGANPCTVSSTGVSLTYYVYDAQGDLAAEYGPVTDYGTKYLIADALGSTRLVVDSSGNTTKCLDYTPFGEEIPQAIGGRGACYGNIGYPGPADTLTEKFTGKERNAETGLDYFGARYLSSAQGRFTSPDPQNQILIRQNSIAGGLPEQAANNFFSGFLENPQNWNRYTYVRNNPLSFTDPTGGAPAPGDGHHLIVLRHTILNPLARAFANAVKTGGPNPPSNVWGPAHAAYNEAEQALLSSEEQMLGSSDFWSLSQWKDFATKLLNSTRPEIKTFLDQIERELPGSRATLAGAISSFKVTPALRTQLALWVVGTDIQLLMSDIVIAVNPKIVEEVAPSHRNCLIDRDTGTCVVY
jgi:RHS repeat-associated protein